MGLRIVGWSPPRRTVLPQAGQCRALCFAAEEASQAMHCDGGLSIACILLMRTQAGRSGGCAPILS
jgi:hypothetical protein